MGKNLENLSTIKVESTFMNYKILYVLVLGRILGRISLSFKSASYVSDLRILFAKEISGIFV